jgi:hypothetical protein
MRKSIHFLLLLLACSITSATFVNAQKDKGKPTWTDPYQRKLDYPENTYLVGFSAQEAPKSADKQELLDTQKGLARTELTQSILVTVKSISVSNIENINSKTHEYFKSVSSTYSNVDVAGLKTETYIDEKKNIVYAFCYAKKLTVREATKAKMQNHLTAIQQKIETAQNQAKSAQKQLALKSYMECYPLFAEVENCQTLLIALGANSEDVGIDSYQATKQKVKAAIDDLSKSSQANMEDAAYFMATSLALQLNENNKGSVRLLPFTYQDAEMASQFSARFQNILEQSLVRNAGVKVSTQVPSNIANGYNEDFILAGTYRDEEGMLKITAVLRSNKTKETVAATDGQIPLKFLKENDIAYKPEGFDEAYDRMKQFNRDQNAGTGGLHVQLFTNKGENGLIFNKGERMRLFIRANRECFIRVIYHLADGQQVLLLDNYYINAENANKVYELPYEFECSEPFGVETLQMNAQTAQFEPLSTKEIDGYKYIRNSLSETLVKTRGFKATSATSASTEKRLTITTMP